MRAIAKAAIAMSMAALLFGGEAAADGARHNAVSGEPFSPRDRHPIAELGLGGRTMSVMAYGPNARARAVGRVKETRNARAMTRVFPGAPAPAIVTIEARISF